MTNKLVSIIAAAVSLLSLSLISCTTTIQEKITSDPPGASIYAGPSPDNLRYIGTTPRTAESTGIYGSAFVPYYYQFKKPGYENSDIIFVPKGPPNRGRYVHANLKPKPQKTVYSDVSIQPESGDRFKLNVFVWALITILFAIICTARSISPGLKKRLPVFKGIRAYLFC